MDTKQQVFAEVPDACSHTLRPC